MLCLHTTFLWPPYGIRQTTIFLLRGFFFFFFYLSSSFFLAYCLPSQIGCVPYFHTWCGLSECEFRMQDWNVLHAARWNTGRKNRQKFVICAPSYNFVGLYLRKSTAGGRCHWWTDLLRAAWLTVVTCQARCIPISPHSAWDGVSCSTAEYPAHIRSLEWSRTFGEFHRLRGLWAASEIRLFQYCCSFWRRKVR